MQADHQHMPLLAEPREPRDQRRRRREIEDVLRGALHQRVQLLLPRRGRQRREVEALERELDAGLRFLHRRAVALEEAGAQDRMACDQRLESPLHRIGVERSLQFEDARQVVGRQRRLEPLQEIQLFLRMGQGHGLAVGHRAHEGGKRCHDAH